jgi:hypothetical protein
MRWGLVPPSAKGDVARRGCARVRGDALLSSEDFRTAWFSGQRGVVPLAGFYVWQRTQAGYRQPYYVRLVNRFRPATDWPALSRARSSRRHRHRRSPNDPIPLDALSPRRRALYGIRQGVSVEVTDPYSRTECTDDVGTYTHTDHRRTREGRGDPGNLGYMPLRGLEVRRSGEHQGSRRLPCDAQRRAQPQQVVAVSRGQLWGTGQCKRKVLKDGLSCHGTRLASLPCDIRTFLHFSRSRRL